MKVAFRCDVGGSVGVGHLLRCVYLARASRNLGMQVELLVRDQGDGSIAFVADQAVPFSTVSASLSASAEAEQVDCGLIVLDLMHAGDAHHQRYVSELIEEHRGRGRMVALIDSVDELRFSGGRTRPDIIVAPYLGEEAGPKPDCDIWLAGANYVPLAADFEQACPARSPATPVRRILVTMGGSDPWELTTQVAEAILQGEYKEQYRLRVIAGPYFSAKQKSALAAYGSAIEIVVSPSSLLEQYEWADAVITTGGLTRYEVAALGLPALMIIPHGLHRAYFQRFADKRIARVLFQPGDEPRGPAMAQALSEFLQDDRALQDYARNGPIFVPRGGARRVAQVLVEQARKVAS